MSTHLSERRDVLLLAALCPLLAVTDTLVNAIGLASATLFMGTTTALLARLLGRWMAAPLQWVAPLLMLSLTSAFIELLAAAWFYDLRRAAGVFLPLLSTNLALLWCLLDMRDRGPRCALELSVAIASILLVLGITREVVGRGSIMNNAVALGQWAAGLETTVFRTDMGFLLAMLPPGAFISLGVVLALLNRWRMHATRNSPPSNCLPRSSSAA